MSLSRSRIRSTVTRPSIRASGPPGQLCTPRANATFCRALDRSTRSSARTLEVRRVPVRSARQQHDLRACRQLDAGEARRDASQPEVTLDGALEAQHFFDEVGDAIAVVAQRV